MLHSMDKDTAQVSDASLNIIVYHEKFGQICVIFCCVNTNFFESSLKATIFVNQYLALIGLSKILEGF